MASVIGELFTEHRQLDPWNDTAASVRRSLPLRERDWLNDTDLDKFTHVAELAVRIFPDLAANYVDTEWLHQRAILTPRNSDVDKVNQVLMEMLPGATAEYRSIDSMTDPEAVPMLTEVLNSLELSGLPSHRLTLKLYETGDKKPLQLNSALFNRCISGHSMKRLNNFLTKLKTDVQGPASTIQPVAFESPLTPWHHM
ncbi:hypothetical protein FJT64_025176 [Amphibalanus amphitrite]|uniref:Uncharacterized protein n=1 Tax=Amphibalanus amphitrite TaxID=1232801 RepID=A0A6A4WKM9_AMPAM|nr:hypothetical protein FJT64_025176 [Amphibalanus amphitrite]